MTKNIILQGKVVLQHGTRLRLLQARYYNQENFHEDPE
ncbi:unnamed protein product, partial [Allacma fusca]